jgi:hypothetical protein
MLGIVDAYVGGQAAQPGQSCNLKQALTLTQKPVAATAREHISAVMEDPEPQVITRHAATLPALTCPCTGLFAAVIVVTGSTAQPPRLHQLQPEVSLRLPAIEVQVLDDTAKP